jgi:hypothetical protein
MAMTTDIFGIVFRFALPLDCPKPEALADFRNFARINHSAWSATRKLDTAQLRLGVRFNRLLRFRDPFKTEVCKVFPPFVRDPLYIATPSGEKIKLEHLAAHLFGVWGDRAESHLEDAEGRPARNKRQMAERVVRAEKHRKLVHQEITARGLPVEDYEFLAKRYKSLGRLRESLDRRVRRRDLKTLVEQRDIVFQKMSPTAAETLDLAVWLGAKRGIDLTQRSAAAYFSREPISFADTVLGRCDTRRSAPRALAAAWFMDQIHRVYQTTLFDWEDEHEMTIWFGLLLKEQGQQDVFDVEDETDLWLLNARQYLENKMK